MKIVDRKTLKSWLEQPDLFLMDVRSVEAWNRSIAKIEHARRFTPDNFGKVPPDLPKNKKLVLYCEDGKTICPMMVSKLKKMGFADVYVLDGGFQAWRGEDYFPVPKELESTNSR